MAVEKENIEIVKLLLTNDKLDINILNIFNIFINKILYYIIQLHSKLKLSITFKILYLESIQCHSFNEI